MLVILLLIIVIYNFNIIFCSTYVQSLKDVYENLNDDIIDKQIEADFPRWFQEFVSIQLNKK